jgi:hypothetical protein
MPSGLESRKQAYPLACAEKARTLRNARPPAWPKDERKLPVPWRATITASNLSYVRIDVSG